MAQPRTKHIGPAVRRKKRSNDVLDKPSKKKVKWAKLGKRIVKTLTIRTVKSPRQIEAVLTPVAEPSEADDLDRARLTRISKLAEAVFGDRDKAARWLVRPKRSLNGNTPLSCLTDATGEQTIQDMLYQIDYGMIS